MRPGGQTCHEGKLSPSGNRAAAVLFAVGQLKASLRVISDPLETGKKGSTSHVAPGGWALLGRGKSKCGKGLEEATQTGTRGSV